MQMPCFCLVVSFSSCICPASGELRTYVYHEGNEKYIQHKLPLEHIGDSMSI
jgi:hypothetical protein